MEARIVAIEDDDGPGVGLVLLTYDADNDDAVHISDPIVTANDLQGLRTHVNNIMQAFEHPVMDADEYDAAVKAGTFDDPERQLGITPDESISLDEARGPDADGQTEGVVGGSTVDNTGGLEPMPEDVASDNQGEDRKSVV